MLLRGVHDKVAISIVGEDDDYKAEPVAQTPTSTRSLPSKVSTSKVYPWMKKKSRTPSTSTTPRVPGSEPKPRPKAFTFSPQQRKPKPSIKTRPKSEISGTCSDSEAFDDDDDDDEPVGPTPVKTEDLGVASDSESNSSVRRSPRRVPRKKINFDGTSPARDGRPPTWRLRKAMSTNALPPRRPLSIAPWSQQNINIEPPKPKEVPVKKPTKKWTVKTSPGSSVAPKPKPVYRAVSVPVSTPKPALITARAHSSQTLSAEVSDRVDDEVQQLVKDIQRVGSNPGEPSVTFGELFDDEQVQQTYEALVGTLRSAKRQGFIKFKGQMLLKGMHDNVVITVAQEAV